MNNFLFDFENYLSKILSNLGFILESSFSIYNWIKALGILWNNVLEESQTPSWYELIISYYFQNCTKQKNSFMKENRCLIILKIFIGGHISKWELWYNSS